MKVMVIEQLGEHDDRLLPPERVPLHNLFKAWRISVEEADERKEHFPARPRYPEWHGQVAKPPAEIL